jgi:hypothetical protein
MKKERIGLAVAILLIVWLSAALVRVENQRYALQAGLCRDKNWPTSSGFGSHDFKCLESVETRTAWYWHLFYALKG